MKSAILLTTLLSFFTVFPQNSNPNKNLNFNATVLKEEPLVDGNILGEALWKKVLPIQELQQIKPNYGATASEKTVIRVAYTSKNLYVAVVCYDSAPDQIVVSDSRRDADLNDDDSFLFIIDTYNDQQNGFLFGTNADGMEYDAQIDNEGEGNFSANRQQGGVVGGTNINWDASWEVKTEKGDYGWSAEFAIPLRSIRFNGGENKTWGINFQRNISKRSETAYWANLPLGFDIKRLSLAGKMHGLNLKSPKNLKVIPYGLVQAVQNNHPPKNSSSKTAIGGDIKYSLTPGLTLDMTYNTDFAQVEVDEQQVNLDRFNLFFPEKRPFFLENAGQFSVGSPGEVDLFFSRRIGIGTNGSLVPIIGGSRVSGKIGQTNIGLLSMFTDEVPSESRELNIIKNNYSVARVNHDFAAKRSSIGGIFVNRSGIGNDLDYNRVFAMDGKLGIGKKAQLSGYVSKSNTPGITTNDHAFNFLAVYNWNGWNLRAGYTEVGEGFNPEVGFLLRSAFKKPEFLIFKQWRPKNTGKLLEVRPHISYRGYWNFQNTQETGFLHVDNHWVWESGFEIHTGINFTKETVLAPFPISNVIVDAAEYNHQELQLVLMTNANRRLYFQTRTVIGGYFGGNRISSTNKATFRVGDKFNTEGVLNYNRLNLPNGKANVVITGARLAYSFTPRMFLQSLVQYNNVSNITSVNARFGWLRNANTGLFVVVNIIKDTDYFDTLNNQSITIKYSHQFDLLGR
ncbi:carbohydrate binding family 9 domain-containing protein [Flavobacteriaceae bacterium]|nr:carbohydrate binding family 9 domain-containing protein [Flavobacteriaceae bacterium]MDB3862025.1 carbohydrate binding family 9 domain-containing protein [Flavobacteriaceae bacterium]MDC3354275.1 carbohydrate binding family 9 domain-containing protein [Flavobacteriaceae bacterium]